MRRVLQAPGLLVVWFVLVPHVAAREPYDLEDYRGRIRLSDGKYVPYYRTHPLSEDNRYIRRAIIVIHGLNRTPHSYFTYVVEAAQREGRLDDTLILAPKFQTAQDGPRRDEHRWRHGWSQGDRSQDGPGLSSFAVVDEVIALLTQRGRFRNLEMIVVAGHSAGGQFVNRYAAGARRVRGVRLRWLVMNPSSYLYLDRRRPRKLGKAFAVQKGAGSYNKYRYGVERLNAYMKRRGVRRIRENLLSRKVYYLTGTSDTGLQDLDVSKPARLQGRHRLERWRNYRAYVSLFPRWRRNATFRGVEGIGHSARGMFNSAAARRVLFR
jgi:hypothetical protein